MSAVCLVDTSVLCEILRVPGKCQEHDRFIETLSEKTRAGETLLLPMATIVETGNHIGQAGDGRQRRRVATAFVTLVEKALDGQIPFTPTPFFELERLRTWLTRFPDWVKYGSGLGDLSIFQEWQRQVDLHPARRVYVWSKDAHLVGYDTGPR